MINPFYSAILLLVLKPHTLPLSTKATIPPLDIITGERRFSVPKRLGFGQLGYCGIGNGTGGGIQLGDP